jgi:PAS domain S-box-containing protein
MGGSSMVIDKNTGCKVDRHKAIVDNMIDAYSYYEVIYDESNIPCDFMFIDINKSFENITGIKREFILNKKVSELFPDTKSAETDWIELVVKAAANNKSFKQQVFSPTVNRWFSCSTFSFEPGCFATIFHDITESKIADEALRKNEENYRSIFTSVRDAIFIADSDTGNIIDANPSACDLYGYTKKEIINLNRTDFVVNIPMMIENIKQDLRHIYIHHKKKDGTIFPVDMCISDASLSNEPVRIITVRDVSNHELVENLKKEIQQNLNIINESKVYENLRTEFFANISHELRTPLNVILSSLQLISFYLSQEANTFGTCKYKKYTKIMQQNCFRLLRLVNNLIDITKIDAGYLDLCLENKNIVSIIEDITLSVAEYTHNKSINLVFDTEIEEKIIAVDSDMIERIILNLLSNAIKFTPPNGSIYVNVYEGTNNIIISIKDTGSGIPEDKLKVIFDRFMQVDKSLTRSREGSGIGLSLVKSLVELHGGFIYVESKLDVGSEFIIELPVKLTQESEAACTQEFKDSNSHVERIHIEFSDIYS